jgi:2-methylcitrate dehydratase PrpD
MGATEQLARFIAESRYEDLPPEVVQRAKIAIMDGVGNMLAGSRQPLAAKVARYLQAMGGSPTSTVVGHSFKTSTVGAAFANGVFGHCLDFEIQGNPPTHGTSSCLPAAVALGEFAHSSGRRLIEAYVVGWEVQGRIRAATARVTKRAFHPPGLVGPLGGAASAARVLGLDAHHVRLALGIAASRAGGLTANTGTMVKSTHPGHAARMGVESAVLAQMDFLSNEDVLEAPDGYGEAMFTGPVDWDKVTAGLGDTYLLIDPGFDIKRFPAQLHMQRPIEAVLTLRQKHGLHADQISVLTVASPQESRSRPSPRTGLDGKFSVEYCGAAAMLDGQVNIDTFTDERRFAPDMQAFLPSVRAGAWDGQGVTATAQLRDGRSLAEVCVDFRGSVANPMSREERLAKFRDCAHRALTPSRTDTLVSLLEHLEDLADVSELTRVLGQQAEP